MERVEKFFFGVAWFMGISIILLGVVHLAFLNPDLRPDNGVDSGWIPLIGEVPIAVMPLAWEFPTGAAIIGGLLYYTKRPMLWGIALALGAISYSIHFFYFPPIAILAIGVIWAVIVRSKRLGVNTTVNTA